jgi:hypothetical protein
LPSYGLFSIITGKFGLKTEDHAERKDADFIKAWHFDKRRQLTKASFPLR